MYSKIREGQKCNIFTAIPLNEKPDQQQQSGRAITGKLGLYFGLHNGTINSLKKNIYLSTHP